MLDTTLSDNNGPTQTHPLIAGSPAVGAVPAANCAISTDRHPCVVKPRFGVPLEAYVRGYENFVLVAKDVDFRRP
jgi:hypothetical protein